MTLRRLLENRWARLLAGLAFWTLIGLSFAFQFHLSSAKAGLTVTWQQAITYALGDWYVFALLSIPVIRLARHFHFQEGRRGWSMLVHSAGSVLFSLAYIALRAWVGTWQSDASFGEALQPLLVKTWHFNLLLYWVMVAVTCAFDYYRKFQDRELRAAELEKRLVEAKLQALQMQLNPHFLFNSLHSISALMHKDIEAADRMVARLSELLRAALDSSDTQEVPLERELGFLRRYLELEQIRFGPRLAVHVDAPAETLRAQVPNLILQPIVENAIRHGIEPHSRPGRIEMLARKEGDELRLQVRDNGDGLDARSNRAEGVGLTNTRARLHTLYGEAHDFQLTSEPGRGLTVKIVIPFHTAPNGK